MSLKCDSVAACMPQKRKLNSIIVPFISHTFAFLSVICENSLGKKYPDFAL